MELNFNRRSIILVCALLGAVTLATYWPVTHHDFVNIDDQEYVTLNPAVQAGLTWKAAACAFTTGHASNWHPLTWLSHMLDVQLFGMDPGGHHLTSLLLHAANALLLFLVLKRMTGALYCSAFAATLFALHPLHVESVAWISERKDVLSTFFLMLTLMAYVSYVKSKTAAQASEPAHPYLKEVQETASDRVASAAQTESHDPAPGPGHSAAGKPRFAFWYVLALLLFTLGLMSKPMLVTLPFVLLLLDYWPLRRFEFKSQKEEVNTLPGLLKEKLPFVGLSAASCAVTLLVQHKGILTDHPVTTRIANALVSYTLYLKQMIWPVDLAVFYPYPRSIRPGQVIFAVIVLTGISVFALVHLRKWPWLAVGWLWYLGTLVPVIGIVRVGGHSMADRYTYVPLIGIFVAIAWGAANLKVHWPNQRIHLLAAASLVAGVLAVLTSGQLRHWQNSETLFRHALAVTADNALAHHSLGDFLGRQGKIDEAATHFEEAVKIKPDYAEALNDLGLTEVLMGRIQEGVSNCHAAIALQPDIVNAHFNLGWTLSVQGRREEAVAEYEAELRLNPASIDARKGLGDALAGLGRAAAAAAQFQQVLQLKPDDAEVQWRCGRLLAQAGNLMQALDHLREAVRLHPAARLRLDLALVLTAAGQPAAAAAQYREMLREEPESVVALNNLAWILAASSSDGVRNGAEAVTAAERACQLTEFRQPVFMGTLAAAYAEAGRFEDAIRTSEKAMALATASGQKQVAEKNQKLLELYRAGKPFREPLKQ
jgi:tetratricopeptide (TPR) repeat protein